MTSASKTGKAASPTAASTRARALNATLAALAALSSAAVSPPFWLWSESDFCACQTRPGTVGLRRDGPGGDVGRGQRGAAASSVRRVDQFASDPSTLRPPGRGVAESGGVVWLAFAIRTSTSASVLQRVAVPTSRLCARKEPSAATRNESLLVVMKSRCDDLRTGDLERPNEVFVSDGKYGIGERVDVVDCGLHLDAGGRDKQVELGRSDRVPREDVHVGGIGARLVDQEIDAVGRRVVFDLLACMSEPAMRVGIWDYRWQGQCLVLHEDGRERRDVGGAHEYLLFGGKRLSALASRPALCVAFVASALAFTTRSASPSRRLRPLKVGSTWSRMKASACLVSQPRASLECSSFIFSVFFFFFFVQFAACWLQVGLQPDLELDE